MATDARFRGSAIDGIDLIRVALVLPSKLHSDTPVAVVVAEFMETSVPVENLRPDDPIPTTTQFTLFMTGSGCCGGLETSAKPLGRNFDPLPIHRRCSRGPAADVSLTS
jgi:hypothetical protein